MGLPPGFVPAITCSAKPDAAVESHQPQFWNSQGPVAREETQIATQILRAGNTPPSFRYASPVNGVLGDGEYGHEVSILSRPLAVLW